MIVSFGDQATQDIYDSTNSKEARALLNPKLWSTAARKMDMVNAAKELKDLKVPPGNKLHALKDDLAGFWAISINDQYRVIFKLKAGEASEVRIIDYHD